MPADDHPIVALKHQLELEDGSKNPVARIVLEVLGKLPSQWPFDKAIAALGNQLAGDSKHRVEIMLETFATEILKHDNEIQSLKHHLSQEESERHREAVKDLVVDATRKAINTRALERVKRIGLILANGIVVPPTVDADDVEEMMRISMELSDNDIRYLGELVRIEGTLVSGGHIGRYSAHRVWESGFWRGGINNEIDSVFSKLESFGLVSRIT